MIVGILSGPDLAYFYELTRLAPVQFITPPAVWLTRPTENVSSQMRRHLDDEGATVKVRMKPTMFRHLYNSDSGIPGFCAAMLPENGTVTYLREQLTVPEATDPFVPYMLLCHDGMRSQAVKKYCRAISDSIVNNVMTFEVFYADQNNPDHQILFDNYNESAQDVFGTAFTFS